MTPMIVDRLAKKLWSETPRPDSDSSWESISGAERDEFRARIIKKAAEIGLIVGLSDAHADNTFEVKNPRYKKSKKKYTPFSLVLVIIGLVTAIGIYLNK